MRVRPNLTKLQPCWDDAELLEDYRARLMPYHKWPTHKGYDYLGNAFSDRYDGNMADQVDALWEMMRYQLYCGATLEARVKRSEARPELGSTFGKACLNAFDNTHRKNKTACSEAEGLFRRSSRLWQKCSRILVADGVPVAFQKNKGEKTFLALEDFTCRTGQGQELEVSEGVLFDTELPMPERYGNFDEFQEKVLLDVATQEVTGAYAVRSTTFTLPAGTAYSLAGAGDQGDLAEIQERIAAFIS
jgi:hypothetical protein